MSKSHLKRLAAPKEWPIKRKTAKFVIKPRGALKSGMPLGFVLRDILGYARTLREARNILRQKEVLVDEVKRKDVKYSVGIMDTLRFPELKTAFRMVLGKNKKLGLIKISGDEALTKVCKVKNKTIIKGRKIQLTMHDGSNIISDKSDYKTGDSLLVELPKHAIKNWIKLEKGALVYLTGGNHAGRVGKVEGVDSERVVVKLGEEVIETAKKFSMAIGTEKPLCTVEENG